MNSLPKRNRVWVVETILVLDDEVLLRMPICQYLQDCGYRVLEAANADEARTILQKEDVQVDVLLIDIEMPGAMTMPSHKFKIGDVVTLQPAISRNVPGGTYQVTKRLPENRGEFEYCIKTGQTLCAHRSKKRIDESIIDVPNLSHLR